MESTVDIHRKNDCQQKETCRTKKSTRKKDGGGVI